jgi:3-hydroxybutyryl-CoA dehydrogenase
MALIQQVGVVGCGLMGAGIAEVCARAGYVVVVREVDREQLRAGLARISASLDRALKGGKLSPDEIEAVWGRISGTLDLEALAGCQLVVEVVPEVMALKRQVFAALDALLQPEAILASNTSSLAVIELAVATRRPQQVLGLHFMQPAPVMPLLEIVRTLLTGEEVLAQARAFGESLGKTVVVSRDTPGFIVNRLMIAYLLHAVAAWEQGIASKEDLDTAVKLGLNHPMGPFALLDLIGLDTALFIADSIYAETRDARYVVPAVLRRMVAAGQLGRKSGRGFYTY